MNRVVIAEDERLLVEMLTELFAEEGFVVTAFGTADEAWRHLKAQQLPPDLLFTDVKMPGRMDGLELADAFSALWPAIPVVISSGHVHSAEHPHSQTSFLAKPWSFDALSKVCETFEPALASVSLGWRLWVDNAHLAQ